MQPIGPLMREHRRIERMVSLVEQEHERVASGQEPDADLLLAATDFFSFYADRTHHGKEEDILFKALSKRDMPEELARIQRRLEDEHERARALVVNLTNASRDYLQDDRQFAFPRIVELTGQLVALYPQHIRTEDKEFFFPCMELFSKSERDRMLEEFDAFDKGLVHEKYEAMVAAYETDAA